MAPVSLHRPGSSPPSRTPLVLQPLALPAPLLNRICLYCCQQTRQRASLCEASLHAWMVALVSPSFFCLVAASVNSIPLVHVLKRWTVHASASLMSLDLLQKQLLASILAGSATILAYSLRAGLVCGLVSHCWLSIHCWLSHHVCIASCHTHDNLYGLQCTSCTSTMAPKAHWITS